MYEKHLRTIDASTLNKGMNIPIPTINNDYINSYRKSLYKSQLIKPIFHNKKAIQDKYDELKNEKNIE